MSLAASPIPFLPARRVVSRGHHGRQRTSCAFTSRTDTRSEVSSPPVFLTLVAMRTGSPRTRRASSSSRSGTAGPIGHTLPVLNAGRSHGCRAPARAWCLASPVGHVCKKCDRAGRRGVQYLPSGLARGRIQADFALVPAGMRPAADGVRTAVSRPGRALPNRAAALRDLSCAGRQPAGGGGPAPLRRARVPDIPAAQPTRLGCGQLSVHHRFLTFSGGPHVSATEVCLKWRSASNPGAYGYTSRRRPNQRVLCCRRTQSVPVGRKPGASGGGRVRTISGRSVNHAR